MFEKIKELSLSLAIMFVAISVPSCMVVYYSFNPRVTPVAVVETVEEVTDPNTRYVEVGELVRLHADGDWNDWVTEPAIADVDTYGPQNNCCNLSFRKTGRYVVFAAKVIDDKVVTDRYEIFVGVKKPEPGKVAEVTPAVELTEWDRNIQAWTADDNTPERKADAARLAIAFRAVSQDVQDQFEKGKLISASDIVKDTKTHTNQALDGSKVDWTAFNKSLNAKLQQFAADGKLDNMRQHVVVWREIATALENYAKG